MSTDEQKATTDATRPRARDLGIPFAGTPGELNAITDVPGVEVGHRTLIEDLDGDTGVTAVRTGATAILPRGREGAGTPVAAAYHSLNGNGEMTGTVWLEEAGALTAPILITNTHSIGACHEGAIRWMVEHQPEAARAWLLPVVAETWDGHLNDINGLHVRPEHAVEAIEGASSGRPAEGSVGGGTGMVCYGFKGGSGTASRRVQLGDETFTVGVILQANFGDRPELTVAGVPIGVHFPKDDPADDPSREVPAGAGSVIVIVGTDAPLLPGQCKALARRVSLGLARTGTTGSHFSGDIFLAFSTGNEGAFGSRWEGPDAKDMTLEQVAAVPWGRMDALYEATVQATEEAVLNVLVAGRPMVGFEGHRVPALPVPEVLALLGDRVDSVPA